MSAPAHDAYEPENEPQEASYDHRLMRRLLADLRPQRHLLVVGVIALVASSLLELLGPYLIKVMVDDVIAPGKLESLPRLVALYLAARFGASLLLYGETLVTQTMAQRIMQTLRDRIFRHIQSLPLSYFDREPVGRVMTRVTNDVEALNEMFSSGVVAIFGDVVALTGIVIAMLLLDARLALLCFSVVPLLFIASWMFRTRVRTAYRETRWRLARINVFLQENLTGMPIVQLFGRERANRRRFETLNADYLGAFLRTIHYYAVFFPVVDLIGALALAAIIGYGGGRVLEGVASVGVLVAFIQYVERFFQPIRDLSDKYNIMQSAMAASERIFGLLDTPAEPGWASGAPGPREPRGEIVFDRVSFRYGTDRPVLEGVSFRASPGEKLAIVGATGAGKTTLMSLLMRFYPLEEGRILLDGTDIREFQAGELRRQIGLVLQSPFLKSGTVWENLILQRRDATRPEVEAAARLVNAHRVIERLTGGYDAEVLEGGANFSTGEKQLLSFARVLVADPRILVLDEATSSVDLETELLIQEGTSHLMEGRTSLVIAHRLSTVRDVDRVLVFHRGTLREEGTHESLLARGGIYHRLAKLYYGEGAVA